MRYGFVLPGGTASEQLELAVLADQSGWDGLFVWESGYGIDAWCLLSAMAMRTSKVALGTMLTPLPWRRPWKLAGQAATLDQLSAGRAILAIGLGAVDTGLGSYGEVTDKKVRAELLDEGIDVIDALWSGTRTFDGAHHQIDISSAIYDGPKPVQQPRAPIWCVGAKDRSRSMKRILRCDGLLPTTIDEDGARQSTPAEVADMLNWLDDHGGRRPDFDVVAEGETEPGDASAVQPYAEVGATWWLETRWGASSPTAVRERIEAGPPRV